MDSKLSPAARNSSSQRCFGKSIGGGIALVLAGAGVHQHGVMRRAYDEGLIGDHHPVGGGVVHHRIQRREVPFADLGIISWEHILRPAPGAVAFDDAGDGNITDLYGLHGLPSTSPSLLPGGSMSSEPAFVPEYRSANRNSSLRNSCSACRMWWSAIRLAPFRTDNFPAPRSGRRGASEHKLVVLCASPWACGFEVLPSCAVLEW